MLTFTKTKNTRLPDSVHNAGVTLQSRDIPHTLPSPIFYERAPALQCCSPKLVLNWLNKFTACAMSGRVETAKYIHQRTDEALIW
jgi:hypothetical protein